QRPERRRHHRHERRSAVRRHPRQPGVLEHAYGLVLRLSARRRCRLPDAALGQVARGRDVRPALRHDHLATPHRMVVRGSQRGGRSRCGAGRKLPAAFARHRRGQARAVTASPRRCPIARRGGEASRGIPLPMRDPAPPTAPRISVVIPTRHRPASLASCLQRLAPSTQTLDATRYEVVVADDGDTGDARALLAERVPWAAYAAGPRRGPAANRNAGVRASRGEWIAFTDDDTLPDRDWLEQLLAAGDGVQAVEGRTVCRIGVRSPREHAPVNELGGRWWTSNLAIRRDVFDTIGGFDERFTVPHMEDADL